MDNTDGWAPEIWDAYVHGVRAFKERKMKHANPYKRRSEAEAYWAWDKGWNNAQVWARAVQNAPPEPPEPPPIRTGRRMNMKRNK